MRQPLRRAYAPTSGAKDVDHFQRATVLRAFAWSLSGLALGGIGGSRAAESTTSRSPEQGTGQKSIAVLPFVTQDSAHIGFAEGISDELRHTLGQTRELRVAAATSALALRTTASTAREIGEALRVTHLLDGSVRASGDSVRITTWLVDAGTDTQIWSGTYTRPLENVFAIQDEIAASVVEELEVRLLDSLPETRRTHPETYRLYLQAQYLLRTGSNVAEQAEDLLTKAREYDATYVPAILLLARVYHRMAFDHPEPYRELTRALVDRALELEPDNGFAHGWRAWLALFFDGDLETAARAYEMSFRLEPSNVDNLHGLQQVSRVFGRPDLAVAFGRYEVILDPVCARCYYQLGRSYLAAGHLDPAEDALRTAERLDPNSDDIDPQIDLGIVQLLRGNPSAALSEFERLSDDNPNRTVGIALASHSLGRIAEYSAAVNSLATRADSARWLAPVHAWAGNADAAFAALEENLTAGRPPYRFEREHADPIYRRLNADPRWGELLRERGVTPDQLAVIDFDPEFPPVVTDALEDAGFSTEGLSRPSS